MCKGSDRGIVIGDVFLLYKEGGRSGVYRREEPRPWRGFAPFRPPTTGIAVHRMLHGLSCFRPVSARKL